MVRNLRELWQYRALLWSLTQRELKARYRGSLLGFFWTFLNPTLLMLVYALVFTVYMRQQVENYLYYMFIGLLPWIWFTTSVGGGASAISDRGDLLTKVRFPAQVLPAVVVTTNFINYVLALPLMIALGLAHKILPTWHVLLFPLIVLIQLTFTLGLVYLISAINVAFRDLQHVIQNLLTLWFFVTPILYPATNIPERVRPLVLLLNPMAVLMTSYQAIFYDHTLPPMGPLCGVLALSLGLLWVASQVFESRREEFAELV